MTNRVNWKFIWPAALLVAAASTGCKREPAGEPKGESSKTPAKQSNLGPDSSPIKPVLDEGWCGGHGVPESVCTRCNDTLIAKFKAAGDWCTEHGLPESQCIQCHPEVEEKWAKLNPKRTAAEQENEAPPPADSDSAILIERNGTTRAFGHSDPLCQIENSRVRFRDAGIVRQAGIEVAPVLPRQMSASIEVPAEVEFDANRVTRITPRVAGVARQVQVNLGDSVQVGDVLALLDSSVLGEAKSNYIERQQNLLVAEADHQRVATITEGTKRLLTAATPAATSAQIEEQMNGLPVGEARSKLLRAHAMLQLARADAAREGKLSEQKINAERDLQAAQAELAAGQAEFLAIREEIAFNVERQHLDAERALQVARFALDAADRRLRILGLTDEQIVAIGTESDTGLSLSELRSPAAGRVIERNVTTGEAVAEDDTLFVIADTSQLWLIAGVYERDLPALREGLPVHFLVDGLPGGGFEGQLNWIASQVDEKTRLVPVRAELANPDGLLRAGMFGRARLILRENTEVLSVPVDAVQTDGCCQLAFVRETDSEFVPRKVRLGASAGGYVEVVGGLREGEMIVTAGSFLMKTEILKGSIGAGCCEVESGR